ncbi:hypothetical protein BC830DRAFT_1132211 [Chytriomyces sp. MP71]|nr:hypothetical protein BC830DRAFT_1132211 [Chytriomyces sp. MP71]
MDIEWRGQREDVWGSRVSPSCRPAPAIRCPPQLSVSSPPLRSSSRHRHPQCCPELTPPLLVMTFPSVPIQDNSNTAVRLAAYIWYISNIRKWQLLEACVRVTKVACEGPRFKLFKVDISLKDLLEEGNEVPSESMFVLLTGIHRVTLKHIKQLFSDFVHLASLSGLTQI